MKKGPFIFLGVLIIILFFILGIQFGKRVKTADEALQLLLTIAPTPSVYPATLSPKNSVTELNSSTCGFSFLYPSEFSVKKTSSRSGELTKEKDVTVIKFNCGSVQELSPQATSSVTLSGIKGVEYIRDDTRTIQIAHPTRDSVIEFTFPTYYNTLIERTLEFSK